MITLDYSDSRPIYEQIVEKYKLLILKGVLAPDEQMPSVRNLAMDISTNPNTVQKALVYLEEQKLISIPIHIQRFINGHLQPCLVVSPKIHQYFIFNTSGRICSQFDVFAGTKGINGFDQSVRPVNVKLPFVALYIEDLGIRNRKNSLFIDNRKILLLRDTQFL